jgi:ribosomal protein S18 acetylase RimI-like enzyme
MDDADVTESLAALRDGYLALFRLLEDASGVAWGDDGDLAWGMTQIPIGPLNRIVRIRLDAGQADVRIREVAGRYEAAGVPCTWWVDPRSTPADLGERFERMGLVSEAVPAMRIESTAVPDVDLAPGVTLSWADDPDSLRAAMDLVAAGFGMPEDLAGPMADLFAPAVGPDSPVRTVVARLDGDPVAVAQGIVHGEAVGIYNVATLEAARGRGIGAAVTIAVLRAAIERGARLGVLESSEMGHSVYRRIGFRDVAMFQVFGASGL